MDTAALVDRLRGTGTDSAELEVKAAAGGFPKDLVETLSAFANTAGGTVLLGLSERDGFAPAPGFDPVAIREALATACNEHMEPPLRVSIDIEEFEDAYIVRADIPELDPLEKPCFVRTCGHYQGSFIRSGDGDRRLGHYEVTQLMANRSQPTYDREAVAGATRTDLDDELVRTVVARARMRQPRAFGPDLTEDAVLVRLNILTESDGALRPTLGGLLCLGEYPQQFFPQLFVSVVVLPGAEMGDQTTDGVRFLDNVTIDGSIPVLLTEAAAVLQRNMRQAAVINGLLREDRYEYPLDVIRELLVNALMHRDYSPEARGTQVQIELYRDRLVIKSPGGLFGDVSAPLLGTREQSSSSRNAALAKLLSDVPAADAGGHAVSENRGSGLPNVMTTLRRAGMSPAVFDTAPGHVHVTVNRSALLGMDVIEWVSSLGQVGLTEPQHLALAIMRSSGRVTNAMLQAWGVDRAAAGIALKDLVERGLAIVSGGRRYASYQLAVPGVFGAGDARADDTHPESGNTGIDADLDAIVQAIQAGYDTPKALETRLGMNRQAVLRRLNKLIEKKLVERMFARNDRRQRYRLLPDRKR
ncbi:ATP-binding protein [Nocardia sp. NPDC050193]